MKMVAILGATLAAALCLTTVSQRAFAQTTTLEYADVKPLIDANCGTCHAPGRPASFFPFTTFAEIKGNHEAMLSAINDDYMPMGRPGFKDTPDGRRVVEWLAGGTDLYGGTNPPDPGPPPLIMRDPRELTYAELKPLIDRHCVGCHNPDGRVPRRPLTNLAEVQRRASDMWKRLDTGRMPPNDPEFRFSLEGRALMGWLRYGRDVNPVGAGDDDGVIGDDD